MVLPTHWGTMLFETFGHNNVLDLANGAIVTSTNTRYGDQWVRVPMLPNEILQVEPNPAWEAYSVMEGPTGGDPGLSADQHRQVWKNPGESVRVYHVTTYENLLRPAAVLPAGSLGILTDRFLRSGVHGHGANFGTFVHASLYYAHWTVESNRRQWPLEPCVVVEALAYSLVPVQGGMPFRHCAQCQACIICSVPGDPIMPCLGEPLCQRGSRNRKLQLEALWFMHGDYLVAAAVATPDLPLHIFG